MLLNLPAHQAGCVRPDLSVQEVLAVVCAGALKASWTIGIRVGVIVCMLRNEPQELVEEIADASVSLYDRARVAVRAVHAGGPG